MTKSGIHFESGNIILVPFPFPNLPRTKKRPVLILSNNSHNELSDDFVCCGITSNLDNKNSSILLEPKDMKDGSIPKKSRIKYDKIFTLEKSLTIKKLGKINSKKMTHTKFTQKSFFLTFFTTNKKIT